MLCYQCEASIEDPLPSCFFDINDHGKTTRCRSDEACYSILTSKDSFIKVSLTNTRTKIVQNLILLPQLVSLEQNDGQRLKLSGCATKTNKSKIKPFCEEKEVPGFAKGRSCMCFTNLCNSSNELKPLPMILLIILIILQYRNT